MNMKERMLANLPYKAWMDGLSEERMENKKRVYRYNNLPPDNVEEADRLIRDILGKAGKNIHMEPPVHFDYGRNTAGHPIHPDSRNSGYEYGIDVTIGDNVWLEGNVAVVPGVTIGDNVVVGAGSVVTKDIPDGVVAAGNPCRVIRKITEEDRDYYFKDRKFDVEDYKD